MIYIEQYLDTHKFFIFEHSTEKIKPVYIGAILDRVLISIHTNKDGGPVSWIVEFIGMIPIEIKNDEIRFFECTLLYNNIIKTQIQVKTIQQVKIVLRRFRNYERKKKLEISNSPF